MKVWIMITDRKGRTTADWRHDMVDRVSHAGACHLIVLVTLVPVI
jgi:hypothetical protein